MAICSESFLRKLSYEDCTILTLDRSFRAEVDLGRWFVQLVFWANCIWLSYDYQLIRKDLFDYGQRS